MGAIITFGSIFLMPILMSWLFRKTTFYWKVFSCLITCVVIAIEPIVVVQIDHYLNPPTEPRCGTPEGAFIMGMWFIGIPLCILLCLFFGWMFRQDNVNAR